MNYGKMLAGNVQQEFLLDKEFTVLSGWESFLKENTEKWIFESTQKKIEEFRIIDTWIVRQFENEYNPLHSHGGHISGVGYLKLPESFEISTPSGAAEICCFRVSKYSLVFSVFI